ncbi:hypothetical protein LZ31DRAFT_546436 [Colletotrichum somersetense]|nr:hypothetical protein LZ31DRAFT_546436 [Colletotrichum somersetense]
MECARAVDWALQEQRALGEGTGPHREEDTYMQSRKVGTGSWQQSTNEGRKPGVKEEAKMCGRRGQGQALRASRYTPLTPQGCSRQGRSYPVASVGVKCTPEPGRTKGRVKGEERTEQPAEARGSWDLEMQITPHCPAQRQGWVTVAGVESGRTDASPVPYPTQQQRTPYPTQQCTKYLRRIRIPYTASIVGTSPGGLCLAYVLRRQVGTYSRQVDTLVVFCSDDVTVVSMYALRVFCFRPIADTLSVDGCCTSYFARTQSARYAATLPRR